jgi:prepilin-type N-terminal cleavage/methylation domain-containing protein
MSGRGERQREAGFSLVEVLVALAITAISTVVLMRGTSQSLTSVTAIDLRMGARTLVKSLIEDELSAATAGPEQRSGESGPYRWTLAIEPAVAPGGTVLPNGYRMYRLTATAGWGRGGEMTVSALKLSR